MRFPGALVIALLAGCEPSLNPLAPDGGMTPGDVTYYEDVRPILADNCLGCHTTGGIAPFTLLSYGEVTEVGERVAEMTRERLMPPFLADGSGQCNTFRHARRLEQAEIDLIGAWVAGGMREGDPSTPAPTPARLPELAHVDATLDIGVEYSPDATADDDYRCFVVEPGWEGRRFLTGYDVRPGNPEVVHHLIVFAPITADEGELARGRDGEDGRPGYTCFGDAGVFALPVVLWAPGAGATFFPEDTGISVDGDVPLIVQVHYNLAANDGRPDRSHVDLQLEERVPTEGMMALLANYDLVLAPRQRQVVSTAEAGLDFVAPFDMRVWAAGPHMHTLGRSLSVEALDGRDTCMIDIPRWDFQWQSLYLYETPIDLAAGTTFRISCTYDTRDRDGLTYWGDRTSDEMCLSFFYVTER